MGTGFITGTKCCCRFLMLVLLQISFLLLLPPWIAKKHFGFLQPQWNEKFPRHIRDFAAVSFSPPLFVFFLNKCMYIHMYKRMYVPYFCQFIGLLRVFSAVVNLAIVLSVTFHLQIANHRFTKHFVVQMRAEWKEI